MRQDSQNTAEFSCQGTYMLCLFRREGSQKVRSLRLRKSCSSWDSGIRKRWQEVVSCSFSTHMLELEYSNVLSVTSTFPLGSLKLQKNSRNTTFTKATSFNKSGKLSSGLRTGKRLVFIPIPKKAMLKNVQTTAQLCLFHMLAR